MSFVRANSIHLFAYCALIASAVGCVRPWSTPFAKPSASRSSPAAPAALPTPLGAADPNANDMAGVMEKLAQVRELDPAAEQKLVDELRRTPPSSWSLVAEQFRASLAMHQQLAARPPKTEQAHDPMAEFRRAPPTDTKSAGATTSIDRTKLNALAGPDRPSAAIGSLVDPRRAGEDSNAELVQSAPYAMPTLRDSGQAATVGRR